MILPVGQELLFWVRRVLTPGRIIIFSLLLPLTSFTAAFHYEGKLSPVAQRNEPAPLPPPPAQPYATLQAHEWFATQASTAATPAGDEEQQIVHAVQSSLPFRLSGLLSNSDARLSMAVFQHGNQQRVVSIAEQLPGTQASVVRIFPDRVVIRHNGRYEAFYIK
ncbi:General secretion pathway protein C [Klebsiella pneumoniae]|nr:General secretion pathway protein C [Klebsiella pneumoniae]